MLEGLLPQRIDNTYRGHTSALWLFALIVFMRAAQAVLVIFDGQNTLANADGIPLATYPAAAAQTIVAAYANSVLSRLFFLLICVAVLVRYRSAIPSMFALLALNFLAAQVIHFYLPTPRTGTPPGPIVNRTLFALMLVGLVLSLWERGSRRSHAGLHARNTS